MHETDVDLAVLDPDKSMVAEMVVDGKTREGAAAVFQCALMYTRSDGIRVLRIHTVSLPTTPKLPEVSILRGACALLSRRVHWARPMLRIVGWGWYRG
jgi:hypothetical protein